MHGLRKVPISYIPIIESSSYVFIIIFSRIFLGEKINRRKTVAILTILAGIGIYLLQNFTLYEQSNSIISDSREFFKKWNELWTWCFTEKHDHHDQPAFNEASFECGAIIKELDGIWNCQLSQGGLAFLENAKIIHYFSSEGGKNYIPYYKLAEKDIQQKVKDFGGIPSDISQMILNPKFQFNKVHLINDKRIVSIMQSAIIFTIADIKIKIPWLFNILESICRNSRNFAKNFKRKK